ncbi:glycine-rich domain-containing protein, partial [Mycobacteroides abscessus]
GAPGAAGAKEKDGGAGGDTTFLINGITTTCAGGAGGKGAYAGNGLNQPGEAAGNTTLNGQTYTGGAQAGTNTNGNSPGGGGGPGSGGVFGFANPGRLGGTGIAHIRSYQ